MSNEYIVYVGPQRQAIHWDTNRLFVRGVPQEVDTKTIGGEAFVNDRLYCDMPAESAKGVIEKVKSFIKPLEETQTLAGKEVTTQTAWEPGMSLRPFIDAKAVNTGEGGLFEYLDRIVEDSLRAREVEETKDKAPPKKAPKKGGAEK